MVLRPCALILPVDDGSSREAARVSQDHLFEVALSAIPEALSNGLRAAGLADPGLLDVYPRDSFDKLVAAGVTGDESGVRTNMEAGIVATGGATMDTGMDDYEGRAFTSVSLRIVSLPRLFLSLSCTASLLPLLQASAHLSVWCGREVATCGVRVKTL